MPYLKSGVTGDGGEDMPDSSFWRDLATPTNLKSSFSAALQALIVSMAAALRLSKEECCSESTHTS